MDINMKLILIYNDKLYKKQKNSLNANIENLKKQNNKKMVGIQTNTETSSVSNDTEKNCNIINLYHSKNKATINDIKMSPQILKQELKDLKKVILIYDKNKVQKKITHKSTVQKQLWKVFNLDDMKI